MGTVWVLDSTGLHEIPRICGGPAHCGALLLALADLISQQQVCFGRASYSGLKALSSEGVHTAWAYQVSASMWSPTPTWHDQQEVVFALEDHVDFDLLDEEPELVAVLALAMRIAKSNPVVVVTEDEVDKPDIVSTVTAARTLGIDVVGLRDFCQRIGIDRCIP